jgi:hypothetical protein
MQLRAPQNTFLANDVMRRRGGRARITSMKAMAFVPAAIAAVLAFHISTASSQQACQKEYLACVDSCATRPSKTMQDGCFRSCEGKNNFCAESVYGKRPMNAAPASVAGAEKGRAAEAMAKKQKAPEAAPAEAREQVAEDRAPEQPQAAPQPRPARR